MCTMNYPKLIVSNKKENFISLQRLHVSPIPTPDFPYFTVKMGGRCKPGGGVSYCDLSGVLSKHLTLCILMILPNILIQ